MKAITYTEYGSPSVLKLTQLAPPVPEDNQILIRVRANSVNYGDLTARNFGGIPAREFNMPLPLMLIAKLSFGLRKPRNHTLGSEFSGEVETVGKDVTRFKPGDRVFGYLGQRMGANAEYLALNEDDMVTHMPARMSYEEAAVLPYGALTAINLLKKVDIQPGQKVLINGASGGIGSAALQLARYYGAEVTGVAGTKNLEFVKALGADHVIDYRHEDFTTNGQTYDLIVDVLGKSSFARVRGSLAPKGRYLRASFKMRELFQMLWTSLRGGQKVICALAMETPEDLNTIRDLAEAGHLKSLIDRCFPLEEAAEAHRYIEAGNKQGQVVLKIA